MCDGLALRFSTLVVAVQENGSLLIISFFWFSRHLIWLKSVYSLLLYLIIKSTTLFSTTLLPSFYRHLIKGDKITLSCRLLIKRWPYFPCVILQCILSLTKACLHIFLIHFHSKMPKRNKTKETFRVQTTKKIRIFKYWTCYYIKYVLLTEQVYNYQK